MDLTAIEARLRGAVGTKRVTTDTVGPAQVERLSVTLECATAAPGAGDPLPQGWHTIFCVPAPARGELGEDGLATLFDPIPPVPMQRRMFGGARIAFHAPLLIGETVRCESELADAKVRTTSTGHLAIATLRHRYFGPAGLAVVEEQDIIHMEPIAGTTEKAAAPREAMPSATWQRKTTPDPLMLFRFSAMTFNSHRIHYDAPYATAVEKLPGLIVQGKLIALLLLETVRRSAPDARIAQFDYRSGRPLYAGAPCALSVALGETRRDARLWAADAKGAIVQTASVTFAEPPAA